MDGFCRGDEGFEAEVEERRQWFEKDEGIGRGYEQWVAVDSLSSDVPFGRKSRASSCRSAPAIQTLPHVLRPPGLNHARIHQPVALSPEEEYVSALPTAVSIFCTKHLLHRTEWNGMSDEG